MLHFYFNEFLFQTFPLNLCKNLNILYELEIPEVTAAFILFEM